jgi:tetratricopeptide (TPR) repeat protein
VSEVHAKLRSLPAPTEGRVHPELYLAPRAPNPAPTKSFLRKPWFIALVATLCAVLMLLTAWRRFTAAKIFQPLSAIAAQSQPIYVESLQTILKVDPKNASAAIDLALAQSRSHHPEAASAILYKVIDANPGNATAYNNLGLLKINEGRYADAIAFLKKALVLRPGYTDASMNLAAAFEKTNQWSLSVAEYESFLQIDHEHQDLHPLIRSRMRLLRAFATYTQDHTQISKEATNVAL